MEGPREEGIRYKRSKCFVATLAGQCAIPSLKNGHLYGDIAIGNKEISTALELLLILVPLLQIPFLLWLGWVRLETEFHSE